MSDEFVTAAESVLRRSPTGVDALVQLEWVPSLDLTDEYGAETFAALFRAQGRSLATTPAMGLLVAQQLGAAESLTDLDTLAAYQAHCQGDQVTATLSATAAQVGKIVLDIGRDELLVGDPRAFRQVGPQPLDPGCVNMTAQMVALDPLAVEGLEARRVEAVRLARLAGAQEILGVSEHLMDLAVTYALDRKQFGALIGSFPAVQQLLAAAEVELTGLRSCCRAVMGGEVHAATPDLVHDAMLVKALAGRVSRRVSQATLQALGAVGFTWEHDHHRYQRRALTLDALFGSYHQLAAELGAVSSRSPLRRVGVL